MSTISRIMIEVKKLPEGGYVAIADDLMNNEDGYSVSGKLLIEDLKPGIKEFLDKLLGSVVMKVVAKEI